MQSNSNNTNSVLASIFILTLLLLGLVPFTLHRLLSGKPAAKQSVIVRTPVAAARTLAYTGRLQATKKHGAGAAYLRGLVTPGMPLQQPCA
jgi:hypothetical protein